MPLDVQLTLHTQVWTLLEASASFTALVSAGNRIKETEHDHDRKQAAKTGPGDFPRVRVHVASDTANDRGPRTHGMSRTDYTASVCDYGVPMTLNVEVIIVHDKTTLADQTPVEAAVRGALLARGPNMGLHWITTFTDRGVSRRVENNKETGGTDRTVSRQTLVVSARPMLSLLTA